MNQVTNSKSNQGRKIVIIVIIAILLAANGVLLWQFFTQKEQITTITTEKTKVISERDELSKQKAELQAQLDSLVSMNNQLSSKLKISDDEIAALQTKINNLQYSGGGNYGASKAELDKLKAEIKAKMEQMAALQKENEGLKSDKDALNSSLNDEKSKEQQLATEKDILANKVALGSVMTADNFKITGAKFSKSGKESATASAKSTQKLKICFTISQNLVVDKGTKTVYIRVLGPDKKCISSGSQTFKTNGQDTPYTVSQDINYNNQKLDQCIYWAKGSAYTKGKYIVEVYLEGNLIGTSSTMLK
jgi:peptidoglycan hydrolase CwlO-like protein